MAEQDKCPYCHTGTIAWIWYEEYDTYELRCMDCDAYGEFKKQEEKMTNQDEDGYCRCCGYPGCMGGWVCPGAY